MTSGKQKSTYRETGASGNNRWGTSDDIQSLLSHLEVTSIGAHVDSVVDKELSTGIYNEGCVYGIPTDVSTYLTARHSSLLYFDR